MSNNKNKNRKHCPQYSQPSQTVQDFDLPQSFRRISSYSAPSRKSNRHESTNSDQGKARSYQGGAVSSTSESYEQNTMGISWESYSRLEDKFTSLSDKNEQEHKDIRREFERKIDKVRTEVKDSLKELSTKVDEALPFKWYKLTIAVLVAIVGLWWLLSYKDVVDLPKEVITIKNRIEKIEDKYNSKDSDIPKPATPIQTEIPPKK